MAMELTPIKIRGKRSAPGDKAKASGRPAKRERLEDKQQQQQQRAKLKPKPKSPGRQHGLSYLECLPLEILERIIVESENLAVPMTSRELYSRLSGVPLKRALVIKAFEGTWENWYGVKRLRVQSYHGWKSDHARVGGDPALQSAILECSWAKLPLILEAFNFWIRHHARDREYPNVELPPIDFNLMTLLPQYPNIQQMFARKEGSMQSRFFLDFTNFIFYSGVTKVPTEEMPSPMIFGHSLHGSIFVTHYIEVHPQTRIPDALLRGPWDDEMMIRLFWLLRAGASLGESMDWELTLEGFKNIMACESPFIMYPMLSIFCGLNIFDLQWPVHVVKDAAAQVHKLVLHNKERRADENLIEFALYTADLLRNKSRRRTHSFHDDFDGDF